MPPNVYANGNSIACKASLDKTIVPPSDVCLSPPSPPAGPVPVPYPNASFSKDTKSGSKNVKIGNKPVMLKNKSYYKSSPLGNEAATRSFGAGLVSHQITGKTFFAAWSMDVKIEGQNVDRHMDITQSNSSNPGNTAGPNTNAVVWGEIEDEVDMCVCCQAKPRHSQGKAMSMDDWYTKDSSGKDAPHKDEYEQLMKDVNDRKSASPPCTCDSKLVSEEPCNVFRRPVSDAEFQQIKKDWKYVRKEYQEIEGIPSEADVISDLTANLGHAPTQEQVQDERQVNHLTPKGAGGCPTGDNNLEKNGDLCSACRKLDKRFGDLQAKIPRN